MRLNKAKPYLKSMALILIKGTPGGDGGYYSICLSFKKKVDYQKFMSLLSVYSQFLCMYADLVSVDIRIGYGTDANYN